MLLESLVKMPSPEVTQFLEALQSDGLPPHLVQRMMLDATFRKSAVEMLITQYRDEPGKKFTIEVDRRKSRLNLNAEIANLGIYRLRDEIIAGLQPKRICSDTGQFYFFPGVNPIDTIDVWTVPLWQDIGEQDAIILLDSMGYKSVETEEALSFALAHSWDYGDHIIVLAAKCQDLEFEASGETVRVSGFLSFSKNMVNNPQVNLCTLGKFSPKVKFLVKKKQS